MNLAEIMAHATTSEETLTQIAEFAIEIGMVPIPVEKEQNGYVLNTWLVALLNAAQTLVTNGVSSPEMVDRTYLIGNRGGPLDKAITVTQTRHTKMRASWMCPISPVCRSLWRK